MEKVYHIYAKDKCIFHSLKEDQFKNTWNTLNNLIVLLNTHYVGEDLSYEELTLNKDILLNSSH
jgi:hypothetical protein